MGWAPAVVISGSGSRFEEGGDPFLNAERVGDAELTPGYTQYDARLQVQTYDVTAAVRQGSNALGVVLADGWFRGQTGITRSADQWGDRLAFLGQLQLTHEDGSVTVVGTGPGWRSATGHIVDFGAVSDAIVRFAKRQRAELIVMGTHGHGVLAKILLGSVAERVISHAPCPVMTVRGK